MPPTTRAPSSGRPRDEAPSRARHRSHPRCRRRTRSVGQLNITVPPVAKRLDRDPTRMRSNRAGPTRSIVPSVRGRSTRACKNAICAEREMRSSGYDPIELPPPSEHPQPAEPGSDEVYGGPDADHCGLPVTVSIRRLRRTGSGWGAKVESPTPGDECHQAISRRSVRGGGLSGRRSAGEDGPVPFGTFDPCAAKA